MWRGKAQEVGVSKKKGEDKIFIEAF